MRPTKRQSARLCFSSMFYIRGVHGLVPESGWDHDLARIAGNGKRQALSEKEGMHPGRPPQFV